MARSSSFLEASVPNARRFFFQFYFHVSSLFLCVVSFSDMNANVNLCYKLHAGVKVFTRAFYRSILLDTICFYYQLAGAARNPHRGKFGRLRFI